MPEQLSTGDKIKINYSDQNGSYKVSAQNLIDYFVDNNNKQTDKLLKEMLNLYKESCGVKLEEESNEVERQIKEQEKCVENIMIMKNSKRQKFLFENNILY